VPDGTARSYVPAVFATDVRRYRAVVTQLAECLLPN